VSTHSKTATAQPDSARAGNLYRLAIVGAASLKGKEVAEVLSDRNFPALDTKLLDDDESLGQLETVGDEVSFIQSVRAQEFDKLDFTSSPAIRIAPAKTGRQLGRPDLRS
jgi:aspartate-semialdehyde dehydrogenase